MQVARFGWTDGVQVFPGRKDSDETYGVPLTRVVYIEAGDFREADVKGYFGLAPNKQAMLKCGAPSAAAQRKGVLSTHDAIRICAAVLWSACCWHRPCPHASLQLCWVPSLRPIMEAV